MKGFQRYVLWELLKVFLFWLSGMTVVMLLAGVGQEAVRQGLGLEPILRLVPFVLPEAMRFAVPATILLATCMVFGRLSRSNEITAIKALGVSPMAAVSPALVMAFILSLVSVWLNDFAVSWGRQGVHRVVVESVEQIAYGMLRTQKSYATSRFSIIVKDVVDKQLIYPTLTFHANGDTPQVTLTADEAKLACDLDRNTLSIFLTNGQIEVGDQILVRFPDTIERVIPLMDASRKGGFSRGPSQCPLREIGVESYKQHQQLQQLQQTLAAEAACRMLSGDFDGLSQEQWKQNDWELETTEGLIYRLASEPWRRWANGFSCFFFVLIGAPMAIRWRSANFFTTFALCFLPILVIYYPLLALGIDWAKNGILPPYSVWMGNLILGVVGIWLLKKVRRY